MPADAATSSLSVVDPQQRIEELSAKLRESEARLAFVRDAVSEGIYEWNIETNALWQSQRLREIFGLAGRELQAGDWNELVHPEDFERYRSALKDCFKGVVGRLDCEYRVKHSDGSYRWVEDRALPVRDGAGRAVRLVGAVTDVTARKEGEQALREALERQTATSEVLQVINSSPGDLTPVFDAILAKAMTLCEAAFGTLSTFDGRRLNTMATRGVPEAFARYRLSGPPEYGPGTGPARLIAGEDIVHDIDAAESEAYRQGDPSRRAIVDLGGARTILNVALRKDEALLGTLSIYRKEVRPFSGSQISLLQGFASQAVIAMENARLLTEQAEALEQQTATAEVLGVINSSPGNLAPVFETMLEKALRLCNASIGILFTYDGRRFAVVAHHGAPVGFIEFMRTAYEIPRNSGLARLRNGERIVHIADLKEAEAYRLGDPLRRASVDLGGARGWLGVALRKEEGLLGAVVLYRQEVGLFSDKQVGLLSNFADQAVIAMENARLLGELRDRQAELRVTFDNMGDGVVMFDADLKLAAWNRNFQELLDVPDDFLASRPGLEDYVRLLVQRGELGNRNPDEEAARYRDRASRQWSTERTRPDGRVLEVRNNPVPGGGAVLIYSDITKRKKAEAEIAAARDAAEAALERQTATADILRVIASSPSDVQPVFDAIAERSNRLIGGLSTTVRRLVDDVVYLMSFTSVSAEADATLKAFYPAPLSRLPGFQHLVRTRDEYRVSDIELEFVDDADMLAIARLRGYRSVVLVPLIQDGEPIGVIGVTRAEPGSIADEHVELLKSFAAQAVIAIENVRLFTELGEALEQQTATADILKVIASSPSDVQPVFDAIAKRSNDLIAGVSTAVYQLADDVLHLMSFTTTASSAEADAALKALFPAPLSRVRAFQESVRTGEVRQISDAELELADDPDGLALARLRGWRSLIAVPLIHDGDPIGLISVARAEPGLVSDQYTQLLKTFAAQAVIAIENVRLFTELRETLEQQTASGEILQVISQSPTDVTPVLDAVAKAAVRFCGAEDASIFLKDGVEVVFAAHEGPIGSQERGRRDPLDGATIRGQAIIDGRTIHMPDAAGSEGAAYWQTQELARQMGFHAVLAAPMLREEEAIGSIALRKSQPIAFTPRQIELLETFAAQAVIAIENVRLFTELRDSLERLKAAQANLIQAEKMASLGQLTAGIAHEIKNPLNFVNNFAGLSSELLDELKQAVDALLAEPDEDKRAELQETMDLLTSNLAKIVEHGRRADGIVKSMLAHSRGGTGDWQVSNINALVEEALNLAYHGARAQDQDFNVTLERDFTSEIKPIEVVPQDVTRVFLNLFGNGFYAAKKRQESGAGSDYRPTLTVSTLDLGEAVEIKVRDNGTGIPPEVRAKLFQPFFTTKPTGEGTGLGLSISYDIVTQQHGGAIEVESEPGAFTEFTVRLPRRRRAA